MDEPLIAIDTDIVAVAFRHSLLARFACEQQLRALDDPGVDDRVSSASIT